MHFESKYSLGQEVREKPSRFGKNKGRVVSVKFYEENRIEYAVSGSFGYMVREEQYLEAI